MLQRCQLSADTDSEFQKSLKVKVPLEEEGVKSLSSLIMASCFLEMELSCPVGLDLFRDHTATASVKPHCRAGGLTQTSTSGWFVREDLRGVIGLLTLS